MAAKMLSLFVPIVVAFMLSLSAGMELKCDLKINADQVIHRCAQYAAPFMDDEKQEKLIELFYNFIEVLVGNSTEIPKATDTMKVLVSWMAICYNNQLLTDNPKLLALAFDCMVENPYPPGSSIEEAINCEAIDKTIDCITDKAKKLCPEKSGNRDRRDATLLTGSHSMMFLHL